MAKVQYIDKRFRSKSLYLIDKANDIIEEFAGDGYDLTLRMLYYQMVADDLIPNTQRSYKNFGNLISDARLAGMIDWDHIVDRTRTVRGLSHWDHPREVVFSAWRSYNIDHWEGQEYRPQVWIEKDALRGVISRTCNDFDTPYLACVGYLSQSAMWRSAQIISSQVEEDLWPVIIYLGDHDPSGIHMSDEDIINRMDTFGASVEVRRIALNMDQIEDQKPAPNPAKLSDSRAPKYISEFGYDSWELDALKPNYINEILEEELNKLIDFDQWDFVQDKLARQKAVLKGMYAEFDKVEKFLNDGGVI